MNCGVYYIYKMYILIKKYTVLIRKLIYILINNVISEMH